MRPLSALYTVGRNTSASTYDGLRLRRGASGTDVGRAARYNEQLRSPQAARAPLAALRDNHGPGHARSNKTWCSSLAIQEPHSAVLV